MDEEQPTAPKVTGAPDAIWLVYGELDADATHAECNAFGDVTWSPDAQYPADVRYTRTDLVAQRVRDAVAAERERSAVAAWNHYMEACRMFGVSASDWGGWCAADAIRKG